MPQDPKQMPIDKLAKFGHFDELRRRADRIETEHLAWLFERAVTDFRTVKRNADHQKILEWCLDQGLDLEAREGWLNEPVVCLAGGYGNNEIVEVMIRRGLPDNPFIHAAVGNIEFLQQYAAEHDLAGLNDENGFNLLFYCARSALGRRDEDVKNRLTDVCRLLLDNGVDPRHEVCNELPISPALLCGWWGGNEDVMRLLLDHGGVTAERWHEVLRFTLEPHQRSGDPFYPIAELIIGRGYDINEIQPEHGRTLLHGSSNRGTIKAVKWLLQHGADPNAQDDEGGTPLHVCADRNTSVTVARLLVDAGSDVNAKDSSGRTALDRARENNRTKVVQYLESAP